jgi:riboflavin biosynthesis pyrimidine reductase
MLKHYRNYKNETIETLSIPFTSRMKEFFANGDFPLITNPLVKRETVIIGMFILRPFDKSWSEKIVRNTGSLSIYDVENWVYNIDGLSGGGVIANGNLMDGYRLAMQYAITDAVIIGSSTVINDGIPEKDGSPGYMWLPQYCADWPHLKAADPEMMSRFKEQRKLMQQLGYASQREYPAQIVVTRSGNKSDPDLLSASIFHENLPDGSPIEVYIISSETGAAQIRKRAVEFNLENRIDDILIILSSDNNPDDIDLTKLPGVLFKDYNIILANHDGGKKVLEAFCQAGIIDQFNFTFARKTSLRDAVKNNPDIDPETRKTILKDFKSRSKNFFDTENGVMPDNFPVAEIIVDEVDEAAVVLLDTRKIKSFKGNK